MKTYVWTAMAIVVARLFNLLLSTYRIEDKIRYYGYSGMYEKCT